MSETADHKISRRTLMKGAGAAAVTTGVAATAPPRYSPIGRAEALAPVVIGGAIVVTGATAFLAGALVNETLGPSNEGLDGYTGGLDLRRELYARSLELRDSNAGVAAVMNNRIQDSKNIAWIKGKAAAIEAMNEGKSSTEAETAALAANDEYYSTIQENLLNHWNSVVDRFEHYLTLAEEHSDTSGLELCGLAGLTNLVEYRPVADSFYTANGFKTGGYEEYTLKDGRVMDVRVLYTYGVNSTGSDEWWYHLTQDGGDPTNSTYAAIHNTNKGEVADPDSGDRVNPVEWTIQLYNDADTEHSTMASNLSAFVTDAYAGLQSGDISTADMIDPVTLASEYSSSYDSTGYYGYAAAQLAMLGVPTDLAANAVIRLESDEVTISGTLFVSDPPTEGLAVGSTYSPGSMGVGDVYFGYSPDSGSQEVDPALYGDVDGGLWTLQEAPTTESVYNVYTNAGESATASPGDFTDNGDGTYTVDLSSQLDSTIVGVQKVILTSKDGLPGELLEITQSFTIEELTNTKTGESAVAYVPESYNQQTSDVTLTQEQLEALLKVREDFDEMPAGGGGISFDQFDFGGIPGEGVVLAVLGIIALLFGANNS